MNANELAMDAATDITTLLMPWITVLLSIIIALMIKEIATSISKGLKFKMSKVFQPGDVVILDGEEATIIHIGLTQTVFERIGERGLVWRYVPNERIQFLKLEKVIRSDVKEINGNGEK
jgi:uncharacterized Zn finger protein